MGFVEFVILAFVIVGIAWGATWALNTFFAGHPPMIEKLIWAVAVIMIVAILLRATGLISYDPKIPHV